MGLWGTKLQGFKPLLFLPEKAIERSETAELWGSLLPGLNCLGLKIAEPASAAQIFPIQTAEPWGQSVPAAQLFRLETAEPWGQLLLWLSCVGHESHEPGLVCT